MTNNSHAFATLQSIKLIKSEGKQGSGANGLSVLTGLLAASFA